MSNPIDPVEVGRLLSKIDRLEKDVCQLRADIQTILELINKSRGALWLGMVLAAGFGAVTTWVVTFFGGRGN